MKNLLADIKLWREQGRQVALATVVKVYGSAPRPLGAVMAVSSGGDMAGSVSGGCVEGNVFEVAQSVLKTGRPQLLTYGIADEMAFEVIGLACGGTIQVFVEPWAEAHTRLEPYLAAEQSAALATGLAGPILGHNLLVLPDGSVFGAVGDATLTEQVRACALGLLAAQRTERLSLEAAGQPVDLFVRVYPPSPRLIVVGAVHIAVPLVTFARAVGLKTVVVDPRPVFASAERFPHADELLVRWPADALAQLALDEACYVVFLSHNEQLDNPALAVALNSPARYIGALGSRKTHARRVAALAEMGLTEDQLARIHAPIGLDLGAVGPEEIAVSIMAEIVAVRRQGHRPESRG